MAGEEKSVRTADLTLEQLKKLQKNLRPKVAYVQKLRERMERVNFQEIDRLLRDARIAEASLKSMLGEIETYLRYKDLTPEPFR